MYYGSTNARKYTLKNNRVGTRRVPNLEKLSAMQVAICWLASLLLPATISALRVPVAPVAHSSSARVPSLAMALPPVKFSGERRPPCTIPALSLAPVASLLDTMCSLLAATSPSFVAGKKSPADLKGYGNTGKAKPKPADRAAGWGPGWEWISESSGPQGEGFLSGTDYLFFQGPTPRTGQQKECE